MCNQPALAITSKTTLCCSYSCMIFGILLPPESHIHNLYLFIYVLILQCSTSFVSLDGEHLWIFNPCHRFLFGFKSGHWRCRSITQTCFDKNPSTVDLGSEGEPPLESQALHPMGWFFSGFMFLLSYLKKSITTVWYCNRHVSILKKCVTPALHHVL